MTDEAKQIVAPSGVVPEVAIVFQSAADVSEVVDPGHPLPSYSPGGFFTATASFTRPADTTAYATGDRVADLTASATVLEFSSMARATGEAVRIERARIRKSGATLTNASFRLHLFRTLPTVSVGDNGVFNASNVLALSDVAGYVGSIDIAMDKAAAVGARGVGVPSVGSGITCEAAGAAGHETSLWAVVEALAAYVPASGETFTVTLEAARS